MAGRSKPVPSLASLKHGSTTATASRPEKQKSPAQQQRPADKRSAEAQRPDKRSEMELQLAAANGRADRLAKTVENMALQIQVLTNEIMELRKERSKAAEIEDSNSQVRDIFAEAVAAKDPSKKLDMSFKLASMLPALNLKGAATATPISIGTEAINAPNQAESSKSNAPTVNQLVHLL